MPPVKVKIQTQDNNNNDYNNYGTGEGGDQGRVSSDGMEMHIVSGSRSKLKLFQHFRVRMWDVPGRRIYDVSSSYFLGRRKAVHVLVCNGGAGVHDRKDGEVDGRGVEEGVERWMGKVLSADDLEAMDKFYRYEDRDGDNIPYRTIPGVHPKGAYFTRGSGHNWKGGYTEDGAEYKEVLDRLTRKWESAADAVPGPVIVAAAQPTRRAIISIGGCDGAVREALDRFNEAGLALNYLRVRGFPFNAEIEAFMDEHDEIFVVEQNRDAQLRSLLINETPVDKNKLVPILDYAGMPANPEFIFDAITAHCETEEA